jgi:hypothetical protein
MKEACVDCPFNKDGPGAHLRRTLRRWGEIQRGLLRGEHFLCHKTTDETGDGSHLLCAGAIAFQDEHGVSSQYVRICEGSITQGGDDEQMSGLRSTAALRRVRRAQVARR